MGCVKSVPAEPRAPPEPVPKLELLLKTKVEPIEGEPQLTKGGDNFTSSDEALQLIFRNIGRSPKGNTFQLETYNDELFHNLQIHPAKPGVGLKKRMEDLVYLHYEKMHSKAVAFAIKNVPKGLNYFLILSPDPVREGQKPVSFEGPTFCPTMYPYATVEFNLETTVAAVRLVGEKAGDEPLYTMRECNAKVWVIKRHDVGVCAAIESGRGVGKLTCYRVVFCAGTDPAFMCLLVSCIDSFLDTAKSQFWKFYDKNNSSDRIDWPKLDSGLEAKLFGRGGWN
ncbi:hypothetical protein ACA910_008319 [Epithemia clementina (nom. ined.)]